MNYITIKSTQREAKKLGNILSPTRNFEATTVRGQFVIHCDNEIQALRDAEFLAANGAEVIELVTSAF